MFAYNQNIIQKPPVHPKINKSPPNLTLVGEQPFIQSHGQPDVIDYHGAFYQHGALYQHGKSKQLQPLGHIKKDNMDATGIVLEQYKDRIDAIDRVMPAQTSRNYHLPSPPSRQDGCASRGGFFHPPSRTSGYDQERLSSYELTGAQSRPTSVQRQGSSLSRNRSDMSRPSSAFDKPSSLLKDMAELDPDHEPIGDVLSRLGDYTQNFVPVMPQAYIDCECKGEVAHTSSKQAKVYSSDGDEQGSDDDDEDDDGSGVSLEVLLKTIHLYEDKGHSALRHKALLTLLEGYTCNLPVDSLHINKIFQSLKSNVSEIPEVCLMVLRELVRIPANVKTLIDLHILDFINSCLNTQNLWHLRRHALLLLEGICLCKDHKDSWFNLVNEKYLPKLLSLVRGEYPLDVKYAACCVFRALVRYEEYIEVVTEDILPAVLYLRNASAKFREVYVEILTSLLSHTEFIPPDLLDSSAIPITSTIIREGPCGPQCAALHLLASVTTTDPGIAMVIGTNTLVTMVLCCTRESHCRRVRVNALEVLRHLCTCRKLGLCKDLMLQLSSYLVPSPETSSLSNLSNATSVNGVPAKTRFDGDRYMWQGLEKFIDLIKIIIFKEAVVKTDEAGLVTKVNLQPCVNISSSQLLSLSHAFHVLQRTCLWPLDKSRLGFSANRVDLTTFTDDDKQRFKLSKVNRGLTQAIWDKVGNVVTDLVSTYADKFHKVCEGSSQGGQLLISLDSVFEPEEVQLIESLLEILLCSSLCTCVAFPEILPKLEEKGKRRSKSPSKLKSASTSKVTLQDGKGSSQVENKLKSQSDVGRSFGREEEGLWVKDNPHLTTATPTSGTGFSLEKSKAEISHKEACTERRLLRKCLYESGALHCVGPFLRCEERHIQVLVLQILRCLVQPLEERVAPKSSVNSGPGKGAHQRPQTAGPSRDTSRRLNIALYKMSPDLAGLIKEALDNHDNEADSKPITSIPRPSPSPSTTPQQRLLEFSETQKLETDDEESKDKPAAPTKGVFARLKIDRCQPIALQCREALLEGVGERLLRGIFCKDIIVKKQFVLLLHDLVHYGENETHMELSKHGCMPKLVDFLRVNETNELLEVMGLIIVRLLVGSDPRLKQLFSRHGGPQLLLAMAQYTTGLIKQEVSTTLKTVTKVETTSKKRPMSAPVMRGDSPSKAPDIWDHIAGRWQQEDQVTRVLRQWIESDRLATRKASWK